MATTGHLDSVADQHQQYQQYRSLSGAAVATLALAVLSLAGLIYPTLLIIAVVAVVLGLYAIFNVRSRAEEMTGGQMAGVGVAIAALVLVGGTALHATIYVLEVPEGYLRISYADLQPDPNVPLQRIPPAAAELDGKRVFIKGYPYPGAQEKGIRKFLLVGDRGNCCFGGDPKITDRIQVTLADEKGMTYTMRLRKIAGVFRLKPMEKAVDGPGGVYYHIDEARLR